MSKALVAILAANAATVLAILPTSGSGGEKKPATFAEVQAQLFKTSWLDVKQIRAGKEVVDPNQLNGYDLKTSTSWGRRGELSVAISGAYRIEATTQPMRLDARGEPTLDKSGKKIVRVRPCIFKLEDGMLIIAGKDLWPIEQAFEKGMDYPERPRDFTSTKENKVIVQFLKPCSYFDQD